jgi:putative ABC transport system permease protein
MASGVFLTVATARYPAVVLGYEAARSLGITEAAGQVWLGGRWYTVIGILRRVELAPEIDRAALIGFPIAAADFGYNGHPSRIYVRAQTERTAEVSTMLSRATDPQRPSDVVVSRPSDALTARLVIAGTTTSLFLGLGTVVLLVGGIGIANVMVISVLERRTEIGLRRALGVARRHIAAQFVVESVVLGGTGGTTGVVLGVLATVAVAYQQDWQPLVPAAGVLVGFAAAFVIGGVAGLYPALRAARLQPTDALRAA